MWFPSTEPILPSRLYDCVDKVIRTSEAIRAELGTDALRYITVTHVWGKADDRTIEGIPWVCPILEGKFETVMEYCERNEIRWLWMDCLCIKQHNSADESHDKEAEVGRMNQYYRTAFRCLCIPEHHEQFIPAYAQLLQLKDIVGRYKLEAAENAMVWQSIEAVDIVVYNTWFSRTWTYQELLLSNDIYLPDGSFLDVGFITRTVDWLYAVLRQGILQKPRGGKSYSYIAPGSEEPVRKGWWVPVVRWKKKADFDRDGHLDLMTAISMTREKSCKYPVDRLYSLYGLVRNADKVPVDYCKDSSEEEQQGSGVLIERWKETIVSIVRKGRVWPLLMDATDPELLHKGDIWLPKITAPELGYGDEHPEVIGSATLLPVKITSAGLTMSVRHVGRVIGTSTSIGDGGGEWNKIIVCIWVFGAMGFNVDPVIKQMADNIDRSDAERGGNPERG